MGNNAFKDKDYIKKRYGTALRVFGFMQGFAILALLFFSLVFTGRFYWLHNYEKAIKNRCISKVEIVDININHGFDDIESFLYTVAALSEIKVKPISEMGHERFTGSIFVHPGTIKSYGFSVGDPLVVYTLPSKSSIFFLVEHCCSISEMFKTSLLFMLVTTMIAVPSVFVFRWKRTSLTDNIFSDNYEEIVGVCISKSPMDRAVRFKYEISGKTRKKEDIVTKEEFKQISVGDKLILFIMRESPKRPFIRPINPVIID